MTPGEIQTLEFRVSVEGVKFDIPVNYHYEEFETLKVWPRPAQAQVDGRERPKVDVIKITALLPDMAPYSEGNAVEFEHKGWGRKVRVYMTARRVDWKYYFDNFAKRLEKLPKSAEAPSMLHYRDPLARHDVYFSHDRPHPELIRILCKEEGKFPYCRVQTVYLDRFDFEISFAREHLSQWRDIEHKLKALFDRFRSSAA